MDFLSGYVYCIQCGDYVYDFELEDILQAERARVNETLALLRGIFLDFFLLYFNEAEADLLYVAKDKRKIHILTRRAGAMIDRSLGVRPSI